MCVIDPVVTVQCVLLTLHVLIVQMCVQYMFSSPLLRRLENCSKSWNLSRPLIEDWRLVIISLSIFSLSDLLYKMVFVFYQTQVHHLKAQMEKMEDAENESSNSRTENETIRR